MTVLITGANRGIGRGLAQHYQNAGETVIATARRPTADEVALDVTQPQSLATLTETLSGKPIDLLVCNAGVYPDKGHSFEAGYGTDIWDSAFATNVTGVFLTIQHLMPNVLQAGGKIAIISSVMASCERAPGGSYAYRASKAAVLNLGRNLAADFAPKGIAIGIYHPGWVKTDMGGAGADIEESVAVNGLTERFAALDMSRSGEFLSYDGTPIPF